MSSLLIQRRYKQIKQNGGMNHKDTTSTFFSHPSRENKMDIKSIPKFSNNVLPYKRNPRASAPKSLMKKPNMKGGVFNGPSKESDYSKDPARKLRSKLKVKSF